jgi:DNA-binding response OmpR family regulator
MEKVMAHLGYASEVFLDPKIALEAFTAKPEKYDLVITDQTMPNITGKELVEELKSIRPDIPVILCTGFSEQIDEKKAHEMGIHAFVMKPIAMRDLAATIRMVLDEK